MAVTDDDARPGDPVVQDRVRARIRWGLFFLLALLLAGGTVWLTFRSGGYFVGETAIAVIALGLCLLVFVMLTPRPFDALSLPLGVAAGALVAFAGWALVSQRWSDAPARAIVEADRTVLYAVGVVLFGLAASSPVVRAYVPRLLTLALAGVTVCGLVTRLFPEVWATPSNLDFNRLSYPISYWNAEGMVAALAIVAALHLATSGRERRLVRLAAGASIPLCATALLLTFSRGAILVLPVGVVAYLLVARPRHVVSALLGIGPAVAVAVAMTYHAAGVVDATTGTDPAAISEGRSVPLVVVACGLGAAALMALLGPIDTRLARRRRLSRTQFGVVSAGIAVLLVGAAIVAGAPSFVSERIDQLGRVEEPTRDSDIRGHLTSVSGSGRGDQYQAALQAFSKRPIVGEGAGTYALLYARYRKTDQTVVDGHSLYLETMAELGVVGLALVLVAILALLAGALRCCRVQRELGGAAFAITLMWALRAGIDWDWELPALTLPVLAFGAVAAGAASRSREGSGPNISRPYVIPRLLAGLVLLGSLLAPLALARSQSHLNTAAAEVQAGQCNRAIASALASTKASSVRPEPFYILAICDLRAGQGGLALGAARAALRRDPHNWRVIYNLAVVRATQGLDPRPGLRAAMRRNPRSLFLREAELRFATSSPAHWRTRGLAATLLG